MRFSWRREVAIGLGTYAAYLAVRRRTWTPDGRRRARRNALRLVSVERRWSVAFECEVQARALRRPRLLHAANLGYGVANVGLTVGWLVVRYRARDPEYHRMRRRVVVAHAGALPVFLLFPVAPPRALPGFVDTLAAISSVELDHPLLVRFYNPIAALPSQHLSFAVVTAGALADRCRGRTARTVAWTYPAVVGTVVVATGNHYVLDVAAGAALGALARRVA